MLHSLTDFSWSGVGRSFPVSMPSRLHQALLVSGMLGGDAKDIHSTGTRTRRRMVRNLSDPSRGFQSRSGEWAALREWTLSGVASLAKIEAERVFLCAKGVRGTGVLCVEGVEVGPFSDGDWEMEITSHTIEKEQVRVALVFAPSLPIGLPPRVGIGVDDGLYLKGVNQLRIVDFHIIPRIVDNYGLFESHLTILPYIPGRYVFHYAAQFENETLASEEITERVPAAQTTFMHRIVLPLPKKWFPGAPNPLILLRMTVERSGLVCDDRLIHTNFRHAEFSEPPQKQFLLDNAPYFLSGTEWSGGVEALLTRTDIEQRLALLRLAGVNCLRVIGAETDDFYDILDEQGFLLWQILPPAEREAVSIIKRVRHRPSLIAYSVESPDLTKGQQNCLRPHEIKALLAEHDSAHPFFGQAAIDPVKPGTNGHVIVDVKGPTAYQGPVALCEQMNGDEAHVRTIACPAPALALDELAGGEPYWPPSEPFWLHRARVPLDLSMVEAWYGIGTEEAALPTALLRCAQAEVIRYAVERARVRGCFGVFTQDPFDRLPSPHSSALFDEVSARPGFWALQSALRPIHACAELSAMSFAPGSVLKAKIYLLCSSLIMGLLSVQAQLFQQDGQLLCETNNDVKPENTYIETLSATLPDEDCVLLLRLMVKRFGEIIDINDYTLCVSQKLTNKPLVTLPTANVNFYDGALRNESEYIAPCVSGAAWAEPYYPGWGTLLPGEVRYVLQENPIEGVNLAPMDFS